MEAVCRGAADEGAGSVGVVFESGAPNRWVSDAIPVADLAERLRRLRDLSDAWIFLPRGLGTMLELVWMAESVVKADVLPRRLVFLGEFWKASVDRMLEEAAGPGRDALARSIHWAKTPEEAAELAFGENPRSKV